MARRDQSNARKLILLNELTQHRLQIKVKKRALEHQIAVSKQQIKDTINIPKHITKLLRGKLKSSFTNSPTKWFIGSTIGGLIISKFLLGSFGSKSKNSNDLVPKVQRGIFFTFVGMVAKPLIKSYITKAARRFIEQKFLSPQELTDENDQLHPDYDIR